MTARDDYPALTSSVSGVLYISDVLEITRQEGIDALDEIDALRAEIERLHMAIGQQSEKADKLRAKLHNTQRRSEKWRLGWVALHDPDNQGLVVAELKARFARIARTQ